MLPDGRILEEIFLSQTFLDLWIRWKVGGVRVRWWWFCFKTFPKAQTSNLHIHDCIECLIWQTFWLPGSGKVKCVHFMPCISNVKHIHGLPRWLSGKESDCQCRRFRFNPWRRKRQPSPEFLPGESHGQRSLAGYSLCGCKESDTTEWLSIHTKHVQRAKSHSVPKRAAVHKSEQTWVKSPHSWPRVGVLLLWRLVVPKQIKQEGQAEEGGDVLYSYMIHVTVQQKPAPHGKAIILQLKIK